MSESPKQAARRLAAHMLDKGFVHQALFTYTDAAGNPIFWRIRLQHPDSGAKWIRPLSCNDHGYELREPDFPRGKPLYRLHELAAKPDAPCWYVEGENCALALTKLGVLATTAGAASSDELADYSPLARRSITIWPDNDAPGIAHAERVAAKLREMGCSVELINARSLGLLEGGDCVDWLHAHPDATAADLTKLPRVRVPAVRASTGNSAESVRVELVSGADIRPEPIEWLWNGWLAAGKLHIIAGAPEAGKTSIALALAATLSVGGRWPDGTRALPGLVVIWSGEDAIHDVLVPRLIALGANRQRVRFVKRAIEPDTKGRPFDPAHHMAALQAELAGCEAKLLILDPIVSAVAGDSHENAKVRRALQPVVDLAEAVGCAVLGVSHFSKGTAGRDPTERVTGSVAFGALPRLVFAAAKLPDEEGGGRIFVRAKSNIGPSGGGFGYELESCGIEQGITTSKLLWRGALEGSARTLLAQVEIADGVEHSAIADAAEWLRNRLAEGPAEAREVLREAERHGFHQRAVQRAKDRIGARARREGFGKGSRVTWTLPVATPIDDIDVIDDKPKRMSPMSSMREPVIYDEVPERSTDVPSTGMQEAAELRRLVAAVAAQRGFSEEEQAEALDNALRHPEPALRCFRALLNVGYT